MNEDTQNLLAEQKRKADGALHQAINRRQERLRQRRPMGDAFERWLYEARRLVEEIPYLTKLFKAEEAGELPTSFRHCSRSPVKQIENNHLTCCLGMKTKNCPILKELFAEFPGECAEQQASLKAHVCSVHILHEIFSGREFTDTSEGYIQDQQSILFWQGVAQSLSSEHDL
jgi:hypothetical protein